MASSALNIGPQHAMQVAERLYTSGLISCPRTGAESSWRCMQVCDLLCTEFLRGAHLCAESTAFAAGFDLAAAVREQRSHPIWGAYAAAMLEAGVHHPKVRLVPRCVQICTAACSTAET